MSINLINLKHISAKKIFYDKISKKKCKTNRNMMRFVYTRIENLW